MHRYLTHYIVAKQMPVLKSMTFLWMLLEGLRFFKLDPSASFSLFLHWTFKRTEKVRFKDHILLKFPLISGVNFCHHSLLQSHKSTVLSYSEWKNSHSFLGLRYWIPLGRAYSAPPDSPAAQQFFS